MSPGTHPENKAAPEARDAVAANLASLNLAIAQACAERGRDPAEIHLVAVSKRQEADRIHAALAAGHRIFGENKVQEAQAHWQALRPHYPDLKLHLIGPLQTNKAADAVRLFDCIETLDREKLAFALDKEMEKQGRFLPCFLQVNTGEEPQKAGLAPRNVADFLVFCREETRLSITGLMCIPPEADPPALHFALLRQMAEDLGLAELSMGMSGDYEKAIALGATYIRLGTAVFGQRDT